MQSFMTPANGTLTPADVARRRKIAEALMEDATSTAPVGHWLQGAARVVKAGVGAWKNNQADEAERTGREGANRKIAEALQGGSNSQAFRDMLGDPWVSNDPMGSKVMGTMFEAEMARNNPKYEFFKGPNDSVYSANPYDPNSAQQIVQGQAPPDNYTLGPGESRYSGGQLVASQPGQKPTDDIAEYNFYSEQERVAGRQPAPFNDWLINSKRAGATTINTGDNSYAGVRNKGWAEAATEIEQNGRKAIGKFATLEKMRGLVTSPDFYSGTGAEYVLMLKRAAVSLNVADPDGVRDMESFSRLTKQSILDRTGGSLGNQISNADREFIQQTTLGLDATPAGNIAILEINGRLAKREMEVAQLARQYEAQHGKVDSGFYDELARWAEANPLFSEQEKGQLGDDDIPLDAIEQELQRRGVGSQ